MYFLFRKKQTGISIPFKASTFTLFLDYAYTDLISIPNVHTELLELLDLATKWELPDLLQLVAKQYPSYEKNNNE